MISVASKLKSDLPTYSQMEGIPLKEPPFLLEDVRVKIREVSQNANLDMREFLGIDKALESIQGELSNNTSKLKKIDKRIQRDTKVTRSKM